MIFIVLFQCCLSQLNINPVGHATVMRADSLARAKPRDAKSLVRPLNQGGRHGAQFDAAIQEEVRHYSLVQTNGCQKRSLKSRVRFLSLVPLH